MHAFLINICTLTETVFLLFLERLWDSVSSLGLALYIETNNLFEEQYSFASKTHFTRDIFY